LLAALSAATLPAAADVKLPAIFGDNMVLQQNMPIKVWGWAAADEKVSVKLAGKEQATQADKNGDWAVTFEPLKAGGDAIELTVTGNNTLTLKNILVGEVWICSGQSNMEFHLASVKNAQKEIEQSDYPQIREFSVEHIPCAIVARDLKGKWAVCGPKTSADFSAVGYFFARDLHKDLKVPVGMIHTSWGATSSEPWTSREGLKDVPWFQSVLKEYDAFTRDMAVANTPEEARAAAEKLPEAWYAKYRQQDPGNKGFDLGYASADFDDAAWKEMKLPDIIQNHVPKVNGAFWFRKAVDVPEKLAGKDLLLNLGPVDDFDTTYFNGKFVGAIGKETPNAYGVPRSYKVAGNLVKAGRNVIAVRVFDWAGNGGINGRPDQAMNLVDPTQKDAPPVAQLRGAWKYKAELELPQMEFLNPPGTQGSPCGLYNGMIAPLTPFPIRGAIWYQGESNSGAAIKYRTVFPALIKDWRAKWNQPEMPFLFVQLANFMARSDQPTESSWAELREAQMMTLALPKTGMAVTIDIGDAVDIHPKDKQDVGKRLELAALSQAYGKDVIYSGPIYKSMKIEGDKVRLSFDHLGGGLVAKDGKLVGFAIAGEDRKFVWADAVIDGDTVVVSSPQVASPTAVRYAWADNPACNLYNKAGLPASPFRTDDWPVTTTDK
jgi:sialate O-acetylesterase